MTRPRDAADEIRLRVYHVRIAPVAIDGACFVASRNGDQLEADLSDLVLNTSAALTVSARPSPGHWCRA